MNERAKHRSKDTKQTAFQLNSRQSRNYLSGKLMSLIRSNDQSGQFSAQELIQMESVLRDELHTNPWLLNVCKAVTDESVIVSKEEIETFEKYKTEGKEVSITQLEVEELHKELSFLKERLNVLQSILKVLSKKFIEIQRNESNYEMKSKKTDSIDIWLRMRTKLQESLEIIENDLTNDLTIEEPKDVADYMVTEFNDKIGAIDAIMNPNEWSNSLLDQLALTESNKKVVLDKFNQRFYFQFENIYKNLNNFLKECLRIKYFYEVNVKEEMSWRTDLNALINSLQSFTIESQNVKMNSMKTESNGLSTKKHLLDKYSKLFRKFEDQEFDEFNTLIEALHNRIQILSDQKNLKQSFN